MSEFVGHWMGTDIRDLSKEQLISVVQYMSNRVKELEKERREYAEHVNWGTYLSDRTSKPKGK